MGSLKLHFDLQKKHSDLETVHHYAYQIGHHEDSCVEIGSCEE